MLTGPGTVRRAGQHARQLDHPIVAAPLAGSGPGPTVDELLLDHHLGVGVGGHLREMRHHQDLVRVAEGRERFTDGQGRRAADSGVDLVEYQRVGAGCEHEA